MKRRTKQQAQQARKRQQREATNFKSTGNSRYAKKVKAGQMYGPMLKVPQYPDFRPGHHHGR